MNKLRQAHSSIERGEWHREKYRGWELEGKTVGIIGYGNTGKSFAKKLKGFDVKVIFHDIKTNLGDENAKQVSLEELQNRANILSLHIPQSDETNGMFDGKFIAQMKNPFWFLNTARGKAVVTSALVEGLVSGKILGAGLDVFEYESASFHSIFNDRNRPRSLDYLLTSEKVLLSPHVAGWTFESHLKLAQTIVDKIAAEEY
jgi:D-3-phosphoglycerate dehydrogenase